MFEQPAINIERSQALQLLPDGSWAPTETRFVQIYHSIVTSGLLADIRGNDLKVLIALGLKASPLGALSPKAELFFHSLLEQGLVTPEDRGRLACFVPHDELAAMAGIHSNTLTACTKRLQKRGLIRICPVSKGAVTWNLYLILPASHLDRFYTYHPSSTGTKIVPVEGASPAQFGTDIILTDSTTTTGTAPAFDFDDQAVLDHFAHRKGVAHYRPTVHDRHRLTELHSAGISQDAIIAAIDRAFDQRPPDAPPIRQFSYCAAIALREHDCSTTGQAVPVDDPTTGSTAAYAVLATPAAAMDTPPILGYVRQLYQVEIGRVTPAIERELEALTQQFPDPRAWQRAFAEAARNEHRRLSYVAAVLRGSSHSREKEMPNGKTPSSIRAKSHQRRSRSWTPEQLAAEQARASAIQPLDPIAVLGTANA